jgi:hypothetical protein
MPTERLGPDRRYVNATFTGTNETTRRASAVQGRHISIQSVAGPCSTAGLDTSPYCKAQCSHHDHERRR